MGDPAADLVVDGRVVAPLEVATTRRSRGRGLLGRDGIDGALWLPGVRSVHTFGMRFAIDVAWVAGDGRVLRMETMRPGRASRWVPGAAGVLESEAGRLADWGLPQARMTLPCLPVGSAGRPRVGSMATRETTDEAPSPMPAGARGATDRLRQDPSLALIGVATLVALAVRLGWVLWVGDRPPQAVIIDPVRYLGYAEGIADGDGYVDMFGREPTAYYPPGYPYFLGLLRVLHRALPGDGSFPYFVAFVQAVIGAALAPLGGIVARRVVSPAAGVVAAFVLALYPNLVFHTAAVLGETLYNTLFMAFLALAVSRRPGTVPSAGRAALIGVPFTLAVLVRPISLAVLPVLALCWWLSGRDLRSTVRATAAVVGVLVIALVPWTIRNAVQLDAFVPMSTNTGDNLCIGHSPGANGGFVLCPGTDGPQQGSASEVRNTSDKTREALAWVRANPDEEPRLVWLRFREMFVIDGDHDGLSAIQSYPNPLLGSEPWMDPGTERRLRRVADTAYVLVVVTGLVGAVRLVRSRWPDGLLVVLSAVVTAAVPLLFFFGDARFKVPVVAILCLATAAAVTWPFDRRRAPPPAPAPGGTVSA